jgi:glycosyltransferase involved in cell wall biosynthesis
MPQPRKLLMVTLYFPPCGAVAALRMTGLARYLPRYGWNPIVVAPPNPPHEPRDASLERLLPKETTTLISVPFAEGLWGKINRKYFPNRLWTWRALKACRHAIRKYQPDAVYTSHPPEFIHEIGLTLKKEFGLPWVACFRDPWAVLDPFKKTPAEFEFDHAGERATIEAANLVVGVSPSYSRGLRDAYPEQAHKIVTITNGYDPDNFSESLSPPPRERLSILYTGEMYGRRDPRALFDAIKELDESPIPGLPKVGFDFVGRDKPEECDIAAELAKRNMQAITSMSPVIPYKECLRKTMQADILVLLHFPGIAHGLPAKIFEYLGARRPILALTDYPGDIAWVLKESGILHRIAPQKDKSQIKQAIVELLRELNAGSPAAPPLREPTPFTRQDMARQLAEQLDGLVEPPHVEPTKRPTTDAPVTAF